MNFPLRHVLLASLSLSASSCLQPTGFTVDVLQDQIVIPSGGSTTIDVRVVRTGGLPGEIHVELQSPPDGVTVIPVATYVREATYASLVVTAASSIPASSTPITLTVVAGEGSGGVNVTTTVPMVVTSSAPGDFGLGITTPQVNVSPGGSATLDLAIVRTGGFDAAIAVTTEGQLPDTVTVDPLTVGAIETSGTLTVHATASAPLGTTYAIGLFAQGGGRAHRGTFNVTIGGASASLPRNRAARALGLALGLCLRPRS